MIGMAVTAYGRPLEALALPEPELRPGEALLEVLTCGVCFSDVKTARGEMPFSAEVPLPHVPGHEICARVVETSPPGGPEIDQLVIVHHYWPCGRCPRCRAGDECLCSNLQGWMGFTHPGGFQERIAVPLDRLVPVPAGIDPVDAAPMSCALGTAYRATVTRGAVKPGTTAAVVGLGGVGIHALQIAQAAGSRAVGLDLSPRAVEVAHAHDLTATTEGDEAVAAAPEGYDVVIVTAGSAAAYRQAAGLVRKGGRIVCVGYALGSDFVLETPRLVLDEVEVLGSRYVSRSELAAAVELVRLGHVRPVVDVVRPLAEVNEAFADLEQGLIVGRTVLHVAS